MQIVTTSPMFPNQVGASPYNQAFSTQLNYGQMLRELTGWHSALDPEEAGRKINNIYRKFLDRRFWYGTKVRGQFGIPSIQMGGQCSVSMGSTFVQGIGTSWTQSMAGLQFRPNFSQPYQTIVAVNPTTQTLTLDMPYSGPDVIQGGYQIVSAYMTIGGNVKRVKWAVNQLYGRNVAVNVPVDVLNARDVWRTAMGWTTVWATRPPTPDGQYQFEMWPTPYQNQTFAFEAYTQPPNLIDDTDCPVAWIRSDIIVAGAVADVLMFKPRENRFYDSSTALTVAAQKKAEFEEEVLRLEVIDDSLDVQNVSWDYGCEDGGHEADGGFFGQTHE